MDREIRGYIDHVRGAHVHVKNKVSFGRHVPSHADLLRLFQHVPRYPQMFVQESLQNESMEKNQPLQYTKMVSTK